MVSKSIVAQFILPNSTYVHNPRWQDFIKEFSEVTILNQNLII